MLARSGNVIARRKFLHDFDGCGESSPGKYSLKQIVAQYQAFGNPAFERALEGINVVDALADIRTLLEQILINIGNGKSIWIETVGAGEGALEQRPRASDGQRRRHARLKNAVPFHDAAKARVETRAVERMGHLSD